MDEAIEEVRRQAEELETIYYMYVVDDEDHLRGLISFRQLLVGQAAAQVDELMERDIVSVNVADDQEEVADKVDRYDLLAIPVVDDEYRLVGIITHDDVIDVIREEATEDAHRMGGVAPIAEDILAGPFRHRVAEAGGVALGAVRGRVVHVHRAGAFRERHRHRRRAEPVRAAVHLDRRQLRLPGGDAHHPGPGAGAGRRRATGGACLATSCSWGWPWG